MIQIGISADLSDACGNILPIFDSRNLIDSDYHLIPLPFLNDSKPWNVAQYLTKNSDKLGKQYDGVIIVDFDNPHADQTNGKPVMVFFNPDGTADGCGNGMRSYAQWLVQHDKEKEGEEFTFYVNIKATQSSGDKFFASKATVKGDQVEVEMPIPEFSRDKIPCSNIDDETAISVIIPELKTKGANPILNVVNTGSTHAVMQCNNTLFDKIWNDGQYVEGDWILY